MTKEIGKPLYRKGRDEQIFTELRRKANNLVAKFEPERRTDILLKAFLFPLLYFACWILAITSGGNTLIIYACYFGMGVMVVLNYLNIIHDAVHHTIFKNRALNDLYVYLFDLLGANSFIWKMRHIRFHHNYPNVDGWDTDIDQSALVRIAPQTPISRFHKYQHLYLPFMYPLFLFNWLVIRDFKDFFDKRRTVHKLVTIPKIEYIKLFFFKFIFFAYSFILPKFLLGISWSIIITAFGIMIFTASILALIVLLPPHANTESVFPVTDEENKLPHSWFMHMLKTTNDIDGTNWVTRFVMGNYNYHIVHHLFPNIHHAFYPEITQELRLLCKDHNLPYRSYGLGNALKNHYLLLKQNRFDMNIWEEDM